jgi:hypothetical protein
MVNDELIVDVIAAIERDPASWNQSTWGWKGPACGTQLCFAGHTVVQAGLETRWLEVDPEYHHLAMADGSLTIGNAARDVLGLSNSQATTLFMNTVSKDDVYGRCAEFMGVDEQVLRDKVRDRLVG